MSEESDDKGFKVRDRRGVASEETEDVNDAKEPTTNPEQPIDSSTGINFASFLLSLSTSAMVHLGETPHPGTQQKDENLEVAKQEIQIIEMLKEKTAGNLSDDENRLIEDVLFHLRMRYVEKNKA